MNRNRLIEFLLGPLPIVGASVALVSFVIVLVYGDVGNLPIYIRLGAATVLLTLALLLVINRGVEWLRIFIQRQLRQGSAAIEQNSATRVKGLSTDATNEVVYAFFSKLYGLSCEELRVHGTLDQHGTMKVMRESEVLAHTNGLEKLDHYLISEARDGEVTDVELVCHTPFKALTKEIQHISSQEVYLAIVISPPLMINQTLHFDVLEKTPPAAIAMTRRELDQRVASGKVFRYESFYWEITQPTKHFELKLIIPEACKPEEFGFDVWYGPSRISHAEEINRINANKWFKDERSGDLHELRLDVMYPIPTMTYAIRWMPTNSLEPV